MKLKKRLMLFVTILTIMFTILAPSFSTAISETPVANEETILEETNLYFDPVAALAVQERLLHDSGDDLTMYGDLALVLHTLGDPVGAVGFEGDYALPDDPNALVEVIVQFHTPPSEVLRMMNEANHPYMQAAAFGRTVMTYEDRALTAHSLFESQLSAMPVPFGLGGSPAILDTTHTLFNGALMLVPAGMMEMLAALPEVFMLSPNYAVHSAFEAEDDFYDFALEFLVELEEMFLDGDGTVEAIVVEEENNTEIVTPADPATWTPGANTWSRGFMREAIELFDLETIWDSGITGRGVRAIVIDSGLDYNHPRYHPFHFENQRMQDGTLGSRVPGSGGNAGVNNPSVPPGAGNILPGTPGQPHNNNSPQETLWNGGWADGAAADSNHGTHCTGSVIGVAPGVTLYAYRVLDGGGAWSVMASYDRMWFDGHVYVDGEWVKYYTRNIVNVSLGWSPPTTMNAQTYSTNVLTLTGYYLIVVCTHNFGPAMYTLAAPSDAALSFSVGAGRMGGWVSPYIFEEAQINNTDVRIDLKSWDWAWMPLDANGWLEAFPENMEEILFKDVFARPTPSFTQMQENQVPRWRRGGGLNLDEHGNAEFVWVGAIVNTVAAREAAFARLVELDIDITGKVIIQARNGYGTPGQVNPRDFWAQRGAGAFLIVDDRPEQTTFSYSGGAGLRELVQGSIPSFSMPGQDGRAALPFPAGFAPQVVISDTPQDLLPTAPNNTAVAIPQTANAATAAINITGVTGTINFGALTDHSIRDEHGVFITQTNRAPNYLATFSGIGPARTTYSIGVDIIGPGTQIHSTWPAHGTNRWARALRNEAGDFINLQGEVIHWETGLPVRDPNFHSNPEQRDWSISYVLQMGTSMSTPTVAGIAALVWEAFPDDGPLDIKARLMNTANRMGSEERGTPYNVFQEGAGFVNPAAALAQEAFATAQVPIHWHFHPNHDPDLVGQPGGPIIGGGLPAGWQSSLLLRTQSSLNFGAVLGSTSQELTVTIHNAGTTAWNYTVNFVTADPTVNQRPLGAFHPDVALRSTYNHLYDGTQTITFVMDFPEGVPHGLYNGHVVFTNAAGGRITMPFAGVPYGAEDTVTLRENSGLLNPIIAGFVLEYEDQNDPRHVTSNTIGALTNSNRSSVQFNINFPATTPGTNVINWANRVDIYARRVEADGSLGENAYVFGTMNLTFTAANAAGMFLARHAVTNRVNDPLNPGQFIYLDEGVYELFIDFNISPPAVVNMQLVPGQAIPLSVGRFVVTDTLPGITLDSFSLVGENTVDITGHISSWAHDMAIEHDMFTIGGANEAGNFVMTPARPVTFEDAALFADEQMIRPDIDGNFTLSGMTLGTVLTAVDGMLHEYTAATGAAVSLAGAHRSLPFVPSLLTTTVYAEDWRETINIRFFLGGELTALPLEDIEFIVDGEVVEDIRDFTVNVAGWQTETSAVFISKTAINWENITVNIRAHAQTISLSFTNSMFVLPPEFSLDIFNNGEGGSPSRPNASLYQAGFIRMWTQLDGVGAPLPYPNLSITAEFPDGTSAMQFVRVNRAWVEGQGWQNHFSSIDVLKGNGEWEIINFSITVFNQTVEVVLVNNRFVPPPALSFDIFNNGVGGSPSRPNASLHQAGLIRMWTQLDGVNTLIPFEELVVTAVLPNGQCAMQFVRVNNMWENPGNVNLIDVVTRPAVWERIYLTATLFNTTVEVILVNNLY
jgi:subtilisin family serine protease